MLKELFINKLIIELKKEILTTKKFDELLKKNNINKEELELEDIKKIIAKCSKVEFNNNILLKLNYKHTINDIELIDKYLINKYIDNENIFRLINNIYLIESKKENSSFKEKINELYEFKLLIDNNLLPYDLVNNFIKVKKEKNTYYQLKEIESIIKNNKINQKYMLLIYLTYNYKIDKNLEESFNNININKYELIEFIKKLETNNIILNNKQIENLFRNYKYRYYERNNLNDKYNELSNKVIDEYSKYYNNHFYFKIKDFIKYYNEKYHDDFKIFTFNEEVTPLTENIFNSLFKKDDIISNYFLFKDIDNTRTLKKINLKSDEIIREQETNYKKRKKFYKKYKPKLNTFINNPDISFKYFLIKYIEECDKNEFYELFKTIYKENYKEIENKKVTTKDKVLLLKKDFITELFEMSFKERYLVANKYKEYAKYIKCDSQIKDNYYTITIEEFERVYYLLIAKNIVSRLKNNINNIEDIKKIYNELNEYLQEELEIINLDYLFNSLSKKHNDLKKEYFDLKNKIFPNKLTKRKCVK